MRWGGTSQIDDPQVHGFVNQLEKATCGNALRQSKGHRVRELDSFSQEISQTSVALCQRGGLRPVGDLRAKRAAVLAAWRIVN